MTRKIEHLVEVFANDFQAMLWLFMKGGTLEG